MTGGARVGGRLAAVVGLMAAAAGLWRAGGGLLAVPLGSLDELVSWAQSTPAPVMAVAIVRVAALGGCAYLALTMSVWVLADATGWWRLARLAARALPATVRCAATGGASVSLAAGVVVGAASPVTAAPGSLGGDPPPATATMWFLGGTPQSSGTAATPAATAATVTMVLLPPEATAPPRPAMDPAAARATLDTWEVGAGDSFWSIAESVVTETTAPAPPSEHDTSRYWSRLIAANSDRLAAPDHADLLIPGQVLVLPQPA